MVKGTQTTGNSKKLWSEMSFSAEEWEQTPKAVQSFIVALLAQVQKLEIRVATLEEQVKRNSRNSSQPPSSDGPEVEKKKVGKGQRKRGGQPGHKGYQRQLVPLEEVKEAHEIKPQACGKCGHELAGEDPEPYRHQVAEIPPVVVEVEEYRLHTLTCPECQAETRGELPAGVPQGAFGSRLQAMTALLTGRYHLSKRETSEVMNDFFQVSMSPGTVPRLEHRTSEAIAEAVAEAREEVKKETAVHMDETGWREANQKAWLWVATTTKLTVFLIRRSRGGKVVKEMLGETFAGIVNSDRWSGYNWLDKERRQLCWSHLIRDFQAFVERDGQSQTIGADILAQVDLMFAWWYQVRGGAMNRTTFVEKMADVQQEVGQLLRQGTECDHKKTAGTCRDILKREPALWTFVHVVGVEPTNNLAERQVRPGVLWRKSSFGTQSESGSRFAERIMSVVATLKLQQRNVLDYLVEACDAANGERPAPALIPP